MKFSATPEKSEVWLHLIKMDQIKAKCNVCHIHIDFIVLYQWKRAEVYSFFVNRDIPTFSSLLPLFISSCSLCHALFIFKSSKERAKSALKHCFFLFYYLSEVHTDL